MKHVLLLLLAAQPAVAQDYRPDRPPLEQTAPADDGLPGKSWDDTIPWQQIREQWSAWEDILRSSDADPQRATDPRRRQAPGADERLRDKERSGCICMDGFFSEATGRGACSTRGGVRYWVYSYANGDTLHWPTLRHRSHPEPLNDAELAQLAAHNPDLTADKHTRRNLWDLAFLALGGGAALTALRLLLRRDTVHVVIHPPDEPRRDDNA